MKKAIKLLCLVSLFFMICACSNGKNNQEIHAKQVKLNDKVITLNDNVDDVIKQLGDPENIEESKSCVFEGNDKVYHYPNIIFNTYPQGDKNFINCITVLTKESEIISQIKVGDSVEQVHEKYGYEVITEDNTIIVYEFEDYGVAFYLNDSKVQQYDLYLIQK